MNPSSTSQPIPADVFIYYSTEDRDSINPVVQLIRAMKADSVFQDFVSIRPD